jgi:Lrp/AsnC family transcriptional regulator, leucine-responsive regulatory protein
MSLDALDRRILRVVQQDATVSAEQLAELCATSPSTALRRLARLRKDKIILAEVALVDGPAVGCGLQMIVSIRMERESGADAEQLIKRIRDHPGVMQFYFVTGSADYVVIFSARTMADYDDFVQTLMVFSPLVVLTETQVVIRPIKMGLAIPIPEPNRS